MRYIQAVVSVFQIPDERTSTAKLQDWAVNLAWGGSDALAASGMMNTFRREGGRQVDAGTYDANKLERLRLSGLALQRQMRRRVEERGLRFSHTRAPASELYWAVVASLVDDGTANANVMRRDASDQTNARPRQQGQAVDLRSILASKASSWPAVGQQRDRAHTWRTVGFVHGRRTHRPPDGGDVGYLAASVVP